MTNDLIPEAEQHWVSNQFLCKIVEGIPENKEPGKHDELQWWDVHALPEKITNTTRVGIAQLRREL